MKNLVFSIIIGLLIQPQAQAQGLTCYEYFYNTAPPDVRKQQAGKAQSADKNLIMSTATVTMLAFYAGILAFDTGPTEFVEFNILTSSTIAGGSFGILTMGGRMLYAVVHEDYIAVEDMRRLSDEAHLGQGATLAHHAYAIGRMAGINIYESNYVRESLAKAVVNHPELCNNKNKAEVIVALYNKALEYYRDYSQNSARP